MVLLAMWIRGLFRRHVGVSATSTGMSAQSGSHADNQAIEKWRETIVMTPINSEGNGVGSKWEVFNKSRLRSGTTLC